VFVNDMESTLSRISAELVTVLYKTHILKENDTRKKREDISIELFLHAIKLVDGIDIKYNCVCVCSYTKG